MIPSECDTRLRSLSFTYLNSISHRQLSLLHDYLLSSEFLLVPYCNTKRTGANIEFRSGRCSTEHIAPPSLLPQLGSNSAESCTLPYPTRYWSRTTTCCLKVLLPHSCLNSPVHRLTIVVMVLIAGPRTNADVVHDLRRRHRERRKATTSAMSVKQPKTMSNDEDTEAGELLSSSLESFLDRSLRTSEVRFPFMYPNQIF